MAVPLDGFLVEALGDGVEEGAAGGVGVGGGFLAPAPRCPWVSDLARFAFETRVLFEPFGSRWAGATSSELFDADPGGGVCLLSVGLECLAEGETTRMGAIAHEAFVDAADLLDVEGAVGETLAAEHDEAA